MSWAEEIGERIREARERLGLSRAALGDLIEAHEKSVGNYERGEHVPWEKLPKLADALDRDLRWLLHGHSFQDPVLDIQAKLERLLGLGLERELATADETDQQHARDSEEAGGASPS